MIEEPISVIDAANAIGMGKQAVFKILRRLSIEPFRRSNAAHRGQAISYISAADFVILRNDVESRRGSSSADEPVDLADDVLGESGVFYLLQLEPEHDKGRFKLGFATNVNERVRSHRCSAPFANLKKTWACKRIWERTAIDCATSDCEQIHTEVFRTNDLDAVLKKCDQFFLLMPPLNGIAGDSNEMT